MQHQISGLSAETIGTLVGALIGFILAVVTLRYAAKLVAGFTPSWAMVAKGQFLSFLVAVAVGFGLGFGLSMFVVEFTAAHNIGFSIVGLGVQSYVIGQIIQHPSCGAIGLKKGFLTVITQVFFYVLVIMSITLLLTGLTHIW